MIVQKINPQELQEQLYERLKLSGWAPHLKTFLLSQDMTKIIHKLINDSQDNKHWTPKWKNVFRAFEECPYNELKMIIIGQDPYPTMIDGIPVADGLAFSCSNTSVEQPSLKYIHQEIAKQLFPDGGYERPMDLKKWANQGILLLNASLTTTIGKPGAHSVLWQPFTTYVLDYLGWNNPGLIYAFLGKQAQEFMDGMPTTNWKFKATHPAFAAYQNAKEWNSEDLFKKMADQLKKNNNLEIKW